MTQAAAGKIEFLDFAKGYAICTIVLYHALQRAGLPPLLQQAIIFGGSGVHLFFLLSGFGLMLSQSGKTGLSVGRFYKRRMLKVWLPYVLALTISLLAAFFLNLFPDRWGAWLAGVGLYQMFIEPYIQSFGGHFWFISVILQFYIVWPALVWLIRRFRNPWLFFVFCLGISMAWWLVVYFAGKGELRTWNSFFLQFLWEFALGMVLSGRRGMVDGGRGTGDGRRSTVDGGRSTVGAGGYFWDFKGWIYLVCGVLFTGLMIVMILKMGEVGRIFNDIPALIGYSSLCIFIFQVSKKCFIPLKRLFLWIGGFSFSLYLIHVLVLDLYLRVLEYNGLNVNWMWVLVYLPLALWAGRLFEWLSRWWVALFTALARGIMSPNHSGF